MAFHWSFRSLPELNHLTQEQQRRLLSDQVGLGAYLRLIRVALFYGLGLGAISGLFTASFVDGSVALIIAAIVAVTCFVLSYQFCMRIIRYDLRLTLIKGFRGEKLPVCLSCGYDLTGIDADSCPECGKGIVVQAKPADVEEEQEEDEA